MNTTLPFLRAFLCNVLFLCVIPSRLGKSFYVNILQAERFCENPLSAHDQTTRKNFKNVSFLNEPYVIHDLAFPFPS